MTSYTEPSDTRPGDLAIITDPDKGDLHRAIALRTDTTSGWGWVATDGDRYAINAVNILAIIAGDILDAWFTGSGPVIAAPDDVAEVDADDMNAAAKLEAAEDRLEALTKAADILNPDVGGGLRFTRSPERARDMLAIEAAKWVLRG